MRQFERPSMVQAVPQAPAEQHSFPRGLCARVRFQEPGFVGKATIHCLLDSPRRTHRHRPAYLIFTIPSIRAAAAYRYPRSTHLYNFALYSSLPQTNDALPNALDLAQINVKPTDEAI